MRRSRPALLFLSTVLLVLCGAVAEARALGIWHRTYNAAIAEAKAENKNLLIVFTGSDWIEICAKFYEDILGQPSFIEAVAKDFALLKLEYPKDSQLPRGEAAEKALLRDAYRIKGFPTVVLTDANGKPFGLNGFQPVPPKDYAEQLLEISATHRANREAAAQASSLEGAARAEALGRAIPDLPGSLAVRFYRPEMEAVIAADPAEDSKVTASFRALLAEADHERELQGLVRDQKWVEAIALVERRIADRKLEGLPLQAALLFRAGFENRAGQAETALATLQKIVEIDPESDPGREAAKLLARPGGGGPPLPVDSEGRAPGPQPLRAVPSPAP